MFPIIVTIHVAEVKPLSPLVLSMNVECDAVMFAKEALIAPPARVAWLSMNVLFSTVD